MAPARKTCRYSNEVLGDFHPVRPLIVRPYKVERGEALERFEKEYLARLIPRCQGNASEAARLASMDRGYLLSLLRRHGLR